MDHKTLEYHLHYRRGELERERQHDALVETALARPQPPKHTWLSLIGRLWPGRRAAPSAEQNLAEADPGPVTPLPIRPEQRLADG
jgi:hypothetical protein